jgi:hypothetical protein
MADKKISELTAITGSNTAATDVFVVVDTSTGQTKKITREELNNAIEQDVLSSIDIDTINGDFTVNGNINLGDNNKAIFGAGSDFLIFHNSANGNSIIKEQGGGILTFQTNGSEVSVYDTANAANMARFITGGGVQLYHNGSSRFLTTATGINVSSSGDTIVRVTSADGNGAFLDLGDASDPDGGRIVYDSGSNLTFSTASTERVRIKSDGKVGIGTTSPNDTVQVNGELSVTANDTAYANEYFAKLKSEYGAIALALETRAGDVIQASNFGQELTFLTGANSTGTVERLRIDSSGRVGIGIASPLGQLHINTETAEATKVYVDGEANQPKSIEIRHYDTSEGSGAGRNLFYLKTPASGRLDIGNFSDGSSETQLMTFLESGNVGIGTSSPARTLHVHASQPYLHMTNPVTGSTTTDGLSILVGQTNGEALIIQRENQPIQIYTNGTERMRITNSGNVGIGTTSPSYPMTIHKTGDGIKFEVSDTVDANYRIQVSGSNIITGPSTSSAYIFQTGNTERMRINSSGNVGIGTSSPDGKLHIDGASDTVTGLVFEAGVTGDNKFIDFQNTSGDKRMGVEYDNNNVRLSIVDRSENKLLTIKEGDGNVGIGTDSPDRLLDIEGNVPAVRLTDTSVSGLHHEILGDGNSLSIEADDGNVGSGSSINFKVDGTERVRITSTGRVGIGTSSPSSALHVVDSGTNPSVRVFNSGNTADITSYTAQAGLQFISYQSDSGSPYTKTSAIIANGDGTVPSELQFWTKTNGQSSPAERLRIDSSGNLGIGTTSPAVKLHIEPSGAGSYGEMFRVKGTNTGFGQSASMRIIGGNSDSTGLFIEQKGSGNSSGSLASIYNELNSSLRFGTNNSERMRIDSSGNLLVGKTSADFGATVGMEMRTNDTLYVARSGGASLALNRTSSDGAIAEFRKDGSTVGSIFSSSSELCFASGNTGLKFDDVNNHIRPTNSAGENRDDIVDLGASANRFKDLYLSGRARAGGSTGFPAFSHHTDTDTGMNPDGAGNIQFTTQGSERMRIDSSGNVGIGVSSPATALDVNGTINVRTSGYQFGRITTNNVDTNNGGLTFQTISGGSFSERMRIDSSGNLLVGKTTTDIGTAGSRLISNGQIQATASGQEPYFANRLSSDGVLFDFRKDGTTVGSIGATTGVLTVGNANTGGVIFGYNAGHTFIEPSNTSGASTDDLATLGSGTKRFRDLYLSGGVYVGGTGSANKLDDYEEGTWTPGLYDAGSRTGTWDSTLTGTYTKIGRLVYVNLRTSGTSMGFTANGGYIAYSGLPFAVVADQAGAWASGSISSHQAGLVYGATNEILWLYAPQTTSSTTNGITATLIYYTT